MKRLVGCRGRKAGCTLLFAVACSDSADAAGPDLTELSLDELANTRVTAVSRTESTLQQAPAAVFVITREMIRRSGATVFPELLRMVPGMDVARIDGNKWAVNVRGFHQRFSDKLLVQVDGRTLYNPLFSGVYWDAVDYPLEDVERIEVIRGPGASVWGANAVNGVIHILTRAAKDTAGGFASAGTGTEERGFATARYGGHRGESLHYRVYGKGFTRTEQFSTMGDPHDAWRGASGGVRVDVRRGTRDTFTLQSDVLTSEAQRKDMRPAAAAPFVFTNAETEVTHAHNLSARWQRQTGPGSGMSLAVYWDRVERKGDRGFVDVQWNTLDVDFDHRLSLGPRQKIVYGIGYRAIDAFLGPSTGDGGFAVSFPPPDRRPQLFTAFAQDQIALHKDALQLTLGTKLERNDHTGIEVQPAARLLWTPTRRQSVWAAVSRAVRTPNLSEDGIGSRQLPVTTSPPLFPRLTSSSDLESETLRAHEVGYRTQASAALVVDVALFANVYDALRVAVSGARTPGVSGTFDLPLVFQNRMTGRVLGGELGATWQAVRGLLQLHGFYALSTMTLHADPTLPAGTRTSAEAGAGQTPRHQVYLRSSLDLPRGAEIDVMARVVDRLRGFNPSGIGGGDVIRGYVALDARLGWPLRPAWMLEVVGQNLLDRHHPETGTAQFLRSSPVEMRRGVYGKLTLRF